MKKMIFLLPVLFSLNAYAGTDWMDRGNAGYVVQCASAPLQTLDLHEAQNFFHLKPDTQSSSSTKERFLYLVSKIEKFNPTRAALYKKWYQLFESDPDEVAYIPKMAIAVPTKDLGTVWVADGCKLAQVVFQRQQSAFNKSRYTVNLDLWNQLSTVDQAALILHEFMHREFSVPPSSHDTSETARKFNGWVNSVEFNSITLQNYLTELRNMFVVKAEYKNRSILLAYRDLARNVWVQLPLEFYNDGSALSVVLERQELLLGRARLLSTCTDATQDKLSAMGILYLGKQGSAQLLDYKTWPDAEDYVATCVPWMTSGVFSIAGHLWEFDTTENPKRVTFNGKGVQLPYLPSFDNLLVEFAGPNAYITIVFDGNFQPDQFQFKGRACMNTASGKMRILYKPSPNEEDVSPLISWDLSALKDNVRKLPVCTPADFQAR